MSDTIIVSDERIERSILLVRNRKIMLDTDLADLYGVTTKRLNEQVKRNIDRFPNDFMFQLEENEILAIRSQTATASKRNIRFLPYVFTEHGVIMAASILNSQRAIDVSVYVVRVFVRLREMFSENKELAHKLTELEHTVGKHDETIRSLVVAIRQLMSPTEVKKKRTIGFGREE